MPRIKRPIARAKFVRGQHPSKARIGDFVENDIDACLEVMEEGWTSVDGQQRPWALILIDLSFRTGQVTIGSDAVTPGMPEGQEDDEISESYFGLKIILAARQAFRNLPIVVFSSMRREDVSLRFSEMGALGFLSRDTSKGPEMLSELLWRHGLTEDSSQKIIGCSRPILHSLRDARRLASQRGNILLRGERGSGKELFARYIHDETGNMPSGEGDKCLRPLVTVKSAVLTPELFGTELFGIEPRTATGVDQKIGLIESANGGDLFLDEIKDMPPQVQAGLLRVLQDKVIVRVGGKEPRQVDVRFLSASNADFESLQESESFRSDLFDRLCDGGTIQIPPLRERKDDIPMLVEHFVKQAERLTPDSRQRAISAEALKLLCDYSWPGNIRELRSVLYDAVNSHPDIEHLVPLHLRISSRESNRPNVLSDSIGPNGAPSLPRASFGALISEMLDFRFDSGDAGSWAGQLEPLESGFAKLVAQYLRAALIATRELTPDNPQGEILIHPAMKLLTGNRTLTASKAADLIKRLLSLSPRDRDEILSDDILRRAYATAVRLRPKSGGTPQSPSSEEFPGRR